MHDTRPVNRPLVMLSLPDYFNRILLVLPARRNLGVDWELVEGYERINNCKKPIFVACFVLNYNFLNKKERAYMKKLLLLMLAAFPVLAFGLSAEVGVKYFADDAEVTYSKKFEFTKAHATLVVEYGNDTYAEVEVVLEKEECAQILVRVKIRLDDGTERVCCENILDAPYGKELRYTYEKTGEEFTIVVQRGAMNE